MSENSISRRSFLKSTAASAAAATVASAPLSEVFAASSPALNAGPGNKWPGRVVVNFDKDAVSMNGSLATVKPETVSKMVDDSIKLLTGESTVGAAWKAVFPSSLTAQSKIAIKVPLGCATQEVAPHWSSVKAIIAGLLQMDIGGSKLSASNITVYDMRCSNKLQSYGYTNANLGAGVKIVYDSEGRGYTDGANSKQYATSLNSADFLLNVFRPGGHGTYVEGLTLGFKNHYGTYPVDHNNTAKGWLRDINCTGVVFKKNVLSVCVGLFGAAEASGRPDSSAIPYFNYANTIDSSITNQSYPPCTIIMSTDPVTAEMQTIKMMRLNNGGKYSVSDMPQYLKASGGISGSLTPVYNIGVIDETKMDIKKIINGQIVGGTGIESDRQSVLGSGMQLHAKQLKGTRSTFIEFNVPHDLVGKKASIEIFGINGAVVFRSIREINGINSNFSWDEKDNSGKHVSNGTYLVKVTAGSAQLSSRISITR